MLGKIDASFFVGLWMGLHMAFSTENLAFEAWSTDPEILRQQIDAVLGRKPKKKTTPRRSKCSRAREISETKRFWPLLPWQEGFVATLPRYLDCADDFAHGVFRRQRDLALNYRNIQFNSASRKKWLTFDLDYEDAAEAHEAANIATPTLIMENPENGHAQIAYQLAAPVTYSQDKPNDAPIAYLRDIQRGMTRRLNADKAYSGHLCKNPLHDNWRTVHLREGAYSLAELASHLEPKEMRGWQAGEREWGLGRNVTLFDTLRKFAYREVLRFKQDGRTLADFRDKLRNVAGDMNFTLGFNTPLDIKEVTYIAKSISGWTWKNFSSERFSQIQRRRGAKR